MTITHGPISGIESFLATKSDSTLMGQMVGLIIGTISARMSWFSRRDNRGGSIMIWLAFSWDRATPVVFVEDSITASRYKIIFSAYLTPMVHALDEFYDAGAIFQQDNARAHTAHATLDWLDGNGITALDWPANSPDLNPPRTCLTLWLVEFTPETVNSVLLWLH